MHNWTHATEQTIETFNPYGFKPIDVLSECTIRENGYVQYELTIIKLLDVSDKPYCFAHGMVKDTERFFNLELAKRAAIKWYEENKQRAAD